MNSLKSKERLNKRIWRLDLHKRSDIQPSAVLDNVVANHCFLLELSQTPWLENLTVALEIVWTLTSKKARFYMSSEKSQKAAFPKSLSGHTAFETSENFI